MFYSNKFILTFNVVLWSRNDSAPESGVPSVHPTHGDEKLWFQKTGWVYSKYMLFFYRTFVFIKVYIQGAGVARIT